MSNQNDTTACTKAALSCNEARNVTTNNEPVLVGVSTCLAMVFPDHATRPSLRAFNEWKKRGYFPQVKIGKRVFLDPVVVRRSLERRFTINEAR